MQNKNKRGQLTIFIIVGIMIVVLGILIYLFYPKILSNLGTSSQNPSAFMQNCLEDEIKAQVEMLSLQGGSSEPENYFLYDNEKVEYLCYTGEYYKTCVVQQPMLKSHIENEIKKGIASKASQCLSDLKKSYESRGYAVNLNEKNFDVELLPKKIAVRFNGTIALTNENSNQYNFIEVAFNNNLYELVSIANSIINWESNYGDAETTTYMNYYHDLKVEKKKQSDGTTIYILTNRNTGDKFQFASRSVAWPPGYGAEGVV